MNREKSQVDFDLETRNEFKIEHLPLNETEEKAMEVIETLQKEGYKAYFAGGWVRDFLMNKRGHDIDIATSAPPEEVEKIFKPLVDKVDATGKCFLVMRIRMGEQEFEVATFRKEAEYSDGRRPDVVEMTNDWEHTLRVMKSLDEESSLELVWAALLHDIGKPETQTMPKDEKDRIRFNGHAKSGAEKARKIMRKLRFSSKQVDAVSWAIERHIDIRDVVNMRKARQRRLLQDSRFELLLRLYKADCEGSSPVRMEIYETLRELWDEEQSIPHKEKKSILNGQEIMKIHGVEPTKSGGGRIIGEIKNALYEAQMEGLVTTLEEARQFVKNYRIEK